MENIQCENCLYFTEPKEKDWEIMLFPENGRIKDYKGRCVLKSLSIWALEIWTCGKYEYQSAFQKKMIKIVEENKNV